MKGLTERQEEIYRYVVDYVDDRGYPPSIRDVMRHFGFKSPKAAADHFAALERKGFIRRAPELSRAIEILARREPSQTAGPSSASRRTYEVPLVGRIAAGEPILAVENVEEVLTFDGGLIRGEGAFLLRVVGDSMRDAHIVEGDYILVKPQESADPGEIVVALLSGEATVKRYFPEADGGARLQPENPKYKPIVVAPNDDGFRIVGRVIGLVRKLP